MIIHATFSLAADSLYPDIADSRKKINPHVIAIAKELFSDVPKETSDLDTWNQFLQLHFLRPKNTDHQQVQFLQQHIKHNAIAAHFKALGLINEVLPQNSIYKSIVIFGGTPWDTQERFGFLQDLIERKLLNIEQSRIVYINGLRKLMQSEVDFLKSNNFAKVEFQHEAAILLWNKTLLPTLKKELELLTIEPPKPGQRANTEDTVSSFFAKFKGDKHLFITNGPYGPYQFETVKSVAQKVKTSDPFEVISSQTNPKISTISFLDTIARRLFTYISEF
jgi:hypothetical protein